MITKYIPESIEKEIYKRQPKDETLYTFNDICGKEEGEGFET